MRRGKPVHALGGGARKDHLFEKKTSLCGRYLWGGGSEVEPDEVDANRDELCVRCGREAGVFE